MIIPNILFRHINRNNPNTCKVWFSFCFHKGRSTISRTDNVMNSDICVIVFLEITSYFFFYFFSFFVTNSYTFISFSLSGKVFTFILLYRYNKGFFIIISGFCLIIFIGIVLYVFLVLYLVSCLLFDKSI